MSKFRNAIPVVGALAIAMLGVWSPAKADTIPGAIWGAGSFVAIGSAFTNFTGATDFVDRSVSNANGFATVESDATPVPSMTAIASSNDLNVGALAEGHLFYSGMVFHPGGLNPSVNLNVTANGSLISMSPNLLFGSDSLDQLFVNGIPIVNKSSSQGNNIGSFTTSMTISVTANQLFSVEMLAKALTQDTGASALAFLDPYFFLDPSLVSEGYSILLSPGIGNSLASATPLPATLPLFATGLGVMGLLGWRRKRKDAAIAA